MQGVSQSRVNAANMQAPHACSMRMHCWEAKGAGRLLSRVCHCTNTQHSHPLSSSAHPAEIDNPSITVLQQCMTEQKYVRGAMTRAMLYLQVSVRWVQSAFTHFSCLASMRDFFRQLHLRSPCSYLQVSVRCVWWMLNSVCSVSRSHACTLQRPSLAGVFVVCSPPSQSHISCFILCPFRSLAAARPLRLWCAPSGTRSCAHPPAPNRFHSFSCSGQAVVFVVRTVKPSSHADPSRCTLLSFPLPAAARRWCLWCAL